ncbi:hypothetical protein AAEO56_17645 [Flavobacterium sp. DGU11]|uniref:Uncharacterized protein n=1 Tax=Flavobacterium arundinis TaxID=3139143 RepID=A0ABU9I1U5_9FLAO
MNSTRNLKLIIAVLFIALVISLFYNPFGEKAVTVPPGNDVCFDFNTYKPSTLTNGLVYDMVNKYRNNQLRSIKGSVTSPMDEDARCIWFDLDTIKKFIYHFEKGVQKNAATTDNKLGLRIYYAAYPDKSLWTTVPEYKDLRVFLGNPVTEQYEKMHTLVMIPTLQLADGIPHDFNPLDPATYKNGLTTYSPAQNMEMPGNIRLKRTSALIGSSAPAASLQNPTPSRSEIAARNHGALYPPGNPNGLGF